MYINTRQCENGFHIIEKDRNKGEWVCTHSDGTPCEVVEFGGMEFGAMEYSGDE